MQRRWCPPSTLVTTPHRLHILGDRLMIQHLRTRLVSHGPVKSHLQWTLLASTGPPSAHPPPTGSWNRMANRSMALPSTPTWVALFLKSTRLRMLIHERMLWATTPTGAPLLRHPLRHLPRRPLLSSLPEMLLLPSLSRVSDSLRSNRHTKTANLDISIQPSMISEPASMDIPRPLSLQRPLPPSLCRPRLFSLPQILSHFLTA
ncbi:hypothetical protein BD626DRAFT_476851 [Schizophyllum amplum]|uniref:Uncharacterized protein n=1 Tax=Schizophyllum amplum TaxID=97359 RepID=A0A550CZQ1_9AGAR|nr:hypothetical protein BD626DRAFT_476851 [Auriculariopsis ampla]